MRSSIAAVATAVLVAGTAAASADVVNVAGFYQEQITKGCNGLGSCEVMFSPVPAGKTLIVRDVGCVAVFTNTVSVSATALSGREPGNALIQRTLYPRADLISNLGGAKRYQIQSSVLHVLTAGQKARMFVGLTGAAATFTTICTIGGELK